MEQFEYDFVEPPPDDFFCPVSFQLLLQPVLLSCCGNVLSSEVADRIRKEGRLCPICVEADFAVMSDKKLMRRVNNLAVRCPKKKSLRCEWVGTLREMESHFTRCPLYRQPPDSQSIQLFEEAMKHGFIETQFAKCLFTGCAGVGKTHLIHLLFKLPPPPFRCSTGCIEKAIRAIACIRLGVVDGEWEKVDSDRLKALLADAIPSCTEIDDSDSDSDSDSDHDRHSRSEMSITEATVANLIGKVSEGGKLLTMTWVYVVDSGGQPQFHQLISAFVKGTSASICVIDLSETLNSHPLVEYFDPAGKRCGSPYTCPLSHADIFQSCTQTIQSFPCTTEGTSPKVIVVGTHKDKESQCRETRKQKNEQLYQMLVPTPDSSSYDNIVFCGHSREEVIFAVNAKTPTEEDRAIANKLRMKIQSLRSPPKPLPLQWYGLELEIEGLANASKRGIVTWKECLELARKLHFNPRNIDEALKAALVYLDELNIFLYYPTVLPDIVFCNPCVLLNKVTELVEQSYKLKGHCPSEPHDPTEGKWSKFCDRGILTLDLLMDFPSHYLPGLFTPKDLLQLFEHLLIIAPISATEFFMPALLDLLKPEEIVRPSSEYGSAYIISFPNGYAPCGLCSALVACLHSSWKFVTGSGKLYGNCITFSMAPTFPAFVTLLDFGSYFEVYVDIKAPPSLRSTLCKSACPAVRQAITDGLKKAIAARNFQNVKYDEAILCRCQLASSAPHPATIQIKTSPHWWSCTQDPAVCGELGSKELVWFPEAISAEPPSQGVLLLTEDDLPKLQRLLHYVRSKWRSIGIQLGIHAGDLDAINQEAMGDLSNCLEKTLTAWLRGLDVPPTVRTLENALSSKTVGEQRLALKVLQEFEL